MVDDRFRPLGAIFDMDGLLLDTERPAIPLWTTAGKMFGWDVDLETVISTLGLSGAGTREIFMERFGPDFPYDKIKEEFRRLYYEKFEKAIELKAGLITLLDRLSSLKIPLAVATSDYHDSALRNLATAGIQDRVDIIVGGDEISRGKPAPDIFLLAAERLCKRPSECAGFEDSPAGLQALHAAGIRSVFIKDVVMPNEGILSTVWRQCKDLAEAVELFS